MPHPHRTQSAPQTRGVTATTTTLVALLAIAAAAPLAGLTGSVRATPDPDSVRMVAAAVMAAACDFLGADLSAALPACAESSDVSGPRLVQQAIPAAHRAAAPSHVLLNERLLDLPPPHCC